MSIPWTDARRDHQESAGTSASDNEQSKRERPKIKFGAHEPSGNISREAAFVAAFERTDPELQNSTLTCDDRDCTLHYDSIVNDPPFEGFLAAVFSTLLAFLLVWRFLASDPEKGYRKERPHSGDIDHDIERPALTEDPGPSSEMINDLDSSSRMISDLDFASRMISGRDSPSVMMSESHSDRLIDTTDSAPLATLDSVSDSSTSSEETNRRGGNLKKKQRRPFDEKFAPKRRLGMSEEKWQKHADHILFTSAVSEEEEVEERRNVLFAVPGSPFGLEQHGNKDDNNTTLYWPTTATEDNFDEEENLATISTMEPHFRPNHPQSSYMIEDDICDDDDVKEGERGVIRMISTSPSAISHSSFSAQEQYTSDTAAGPPDPASHFGRGMDWILTPGMTTHEEPGIESTHRPDYDHRQPQHPEFSQKRTHFPEFDDIEFDDYIGSQLPAGFFTGRADAVKKTTEQLLDELAAESLSSQQATSMVRDLDTITEVSETEDLTSISSNGGSDKYTVKHQNSEFRCDSPTAGLEASPSSYRLASTLTACSSSATEDTVSDVDGEPAVPRNGEQCMSSGRSPPSSDMSSGRSPPTPDLPPARTLRFPGNEEEKIDHVFPSGVMRTGREVGEQVEGKREACLPEENGNQLDAENTGAGYENGLPNRVDDNRQSIAPLQRALISPLRRFSYELDLKHGNAADAAEWSGNEIAKIYTSNIDDEELENELEFETFSTVTSSGRTSVATDLPTDEYSLLYTNPKRPPDQAVQAGNSVQAIPQGNSVPEDCTSGKFKEWPATRGREDLKGENKEWKTDDLETEEAVWKTEDLEREEVVWKKEEKHSKVEKHDRRGNENDWAVSLKREGQLNESDDIENNSRGETSPSCLTRKGKEDGSFTVSGEEAYTVTPGETECNENDTRQDTTILVFLGAEQGDALSFSRRPPREHRLLLAYQKYHNLKSEEGGVQSSELSSSLSSEPTRTTLLRQEISKDVSSLVEVDDGGSSCMDQIDLQKALQRFARYGELYGDAPKSGMEEFGGGNKDIDDSTLDVASRMSSLPSTGSAAKMEALLRSTLSTKGSTSPYYCAGNTGSRSPSASLTAAKREPEQAVDDVAGGEGVVLVNTDPRTVTGAIHALASRKDDVTNDQMEFIDKGKHQGVGDGRSPGKGPNNKGGVVSSQYNTDEFHSPDKDRYSTRYTPTTPAGVIKTTVQGERNSSDVIRTVSVERISGIRPTSAPLTPLLASASSPTSGFRSSGLTTSYDHPTEPVCVASATSQAIVNDPADSNAHSAFFSSKNQRKILAEASANAVASNPYIALARATTAAASKVAEASNENLLDVGETGTVSLIVSSTVTTTKRDFYSTTKSTPDLLFLSSTDVYDVSGLELRNQRHQENMNSTQQQQVTPVYGVIPRGTASIFQQRHRELSPGRKAGTRSPERKRHHHEMNGNTGHVTAPPSDRSERDAKKALFASSDHLQQLLDDPYYMKEQRKPVPAARTPKVDTVAGPVPATSPTIPLSQRNVTDWNSRPENSLQSQKQQNLLRWRNSMNLAENEELRRAMLEDQKAEKQISPTKSGLAEDSMEDGSYYGTESKRSSSALATTPVVELWDYKIFREEQKKTEEDNKKDRRNKYKAKIERAKKDYLATKASASDLYRSIEDFEKKFNISMENVRLPDPPRGPYLEHLSRSGNLHVIDPNEVPPPAYIRPKPRFDKEYESIVKNAEQRWAAYKRRLHAAASKHGDDLYARSRAYSTGFLETDIDDETPRAQKSIVETDLDAVQREIEHGSRKRSKTPSSAAANGAVPSGRNAHSRAKSADFLMDQRARTEIEPPENQLQKILGDKEEKDLSEHELRFRKSIEKLHVPDWYLNSDYCPAGKIPSPDQNRSRSSTYQRPTSTQSHYSGKGAADATSPRSYRKSQTSTPVRFQDTSASSRYTSPMVYGGRISGPQGMKTPETARRPTESPSPGIGRKITDSPPKPSARRPDSVKQPQPLRPEPRRVIEQRSEYHATSTTSTTSTSYSLTKSLVDKPIPTSPQKQPFVIPKNFFAKYKDEIEEMRKSRHNIRDIDDEYMEDQRGNRLSAFGIPVPVATVRPTQLHEDDFDTTTSLSFSPTSSPEVRPGLKSGSKTPGYGAPTSASGGPMPGYGAPGSGAPRSGYGAPAPGSGVPTSGYGAPGSGAPTSGYGTPTPGSVAPTSGYSAPTPQPRGQHRPQPTPAPRSTGSYRDGPLNTSTPYSSEQLPRKPVPVARETAFEAYHHQDDQAPQYPAPQPPQVARQSSFRSQEPRHMPGGWTVSAVPPDWNVPGKRDSVVIEVAGDGLFDASSGSKDGKGRRIPSNLTLEEVLDSMFALPVTGKSVLTTINESSSSLLDDSLPVRPRTPTNLEGPGIYAHNQELMEKCMGEPEIAADVLKDEPLWVKCGYCSRTCQLEEARHRGFVSCHHCYTYYCNRICRRCDWDRHLDICSYARVNTLCKQVILKVRQDIESQFQMSRVAQRGYQNRGRGSVNFRFITLTLAKSYVKDPGGGWRSFHSPPNDPGEFLHYYTVPDLVDAQKDPSLVNLCRRYDPRSKFVLSVSIMADIEECPETPPPESIADPVYPNQQSSWYQRGIGGVPAGPTNARPAPFSGNEYSWINDAKKPYSGNGYSKDDIYDYDPPQNGQYFVRGDQHRHTVATTPRSGHGGKGNNGHWEGQTGRPGLLIGPEDADETEV